MKFTLRHADKFVGLFVLAATLAVALSLIYAGVNKRWFERDLEYRSYFDTAEGLSAGLDLELRGFAVGRVKSVTLQPDNKVELVLTVFNEHADRIVEDSVVSLAVSPMGFGSSLVLYPGLRSTTPLPAGAVIPSSDTARGRELIAEGLVDRPQRKDEVTNMLGTLPPLLENVGGLVVTMDSLMTHFDHHLMGASSEPGTGLMSTVNTTLITTDTAVRRFTAMAAGLDTMVTQLNRAMAGVNGLLNAPEGMVPALMGDGGTPGLLFRDGGRLLESMMQIMDEMRTMMSFLNESTPEIAALMEESTSALIESEKLIQGLQNNPLVRGGIPRDREANALFDGHRQEVR